MRAFLLYLLLIPCPLLLSAQADSGFTNKTEAKNQLVNGKKEGKWCEYVNASNLGLGLFGDNDSVYRLTVYAGGNPSGMVRIYRLNGKLWCIIPYKDGKENGMQKEYGYTPQGDGKTDKNCILEIPWVNGEINGMMKEYYGNGKIKREQLYNNSEPKGDAKDYDENGKVIIQYKE